MSARRWLGLPLVAGFLALPSVLSGGGDDQRGEYRATPSTVSPAGEEPRARVRWVFREQDLVTCRTPASVLRHLRARYSRDELDVAAFAVGMTQSRAESFLRAERLTVPVTSMSEAALQAQSPGTPPPGLYFLLGDSVVAGYEATEIGRYPELAEVEPVLPRLFPSTGAAGN